MSFNKVIILGNAGRDPEVRHLEGGGVVANFTVATSERFKDRVGNIQERTEWHTIVCWRQLAEFAEKYIRKGSQVFIEGKIRTRDYTDQSGQKRYVTEIFADTLQLTGRRVDTQTNQQPAQQAAQPHQSAQPYQTTQNTVNQTINNNIDIPANDDYSADSADDLPF